MRARWNPALEQRPASLQDNAEERRMPDQVGDDEEVRKETRRWRFRAHAIPGRGGGGVVGVLGWGGAGGIAVPGAPEWVASCNCSFCTKAGWLVAYYPDDG